MTELSGQSFAKVADFSPSGLVLTDASGEISFANRAVRQLLGVGEGALDRSAWLSGTHPDDRDRVAEIWRQMVVTGSGRRASYRFCVAGDVIWIQVDAAVVSDAAGHLSGFLCSVVDITEERELRLQAERLSGLYETLSQVNSSIVHSADEQALYEAVCNSLTAKGWLLGASVSVIDAERQTAGLVACAGAWCDEVQCHLAEIDWSHAAAPTLMMQPLLTGALLLAEDVGNDERVQPQFRALIRRLGIHTLCALPLKCFGQTKAVMMLGASEKHFFNAEILALVEEAGRDVSFALEYFQREQLRRHAEEEVLRNEEKLRVTLRSIGDAVLVTDTAARITMMNPVAEALTGWSEHDAIGRLATEVFHIVNEDTREIVESPVDRVLREGTVVGLANHTVLIAKDGSELPIADSGAPIRRDDAGESIGVVLVFRDQSEEHRMQQALRDSERLYSTLVTFAPVGIFRTDAPGTMVFANDALLGLAGVRRDEIMSPQRWAAAYHEEDRARVGRAWSVAMANNVAAEALTYRYVRPDGRETWAHARATPLLDDKGALTGYVGVVTDITRERQHQQQVEWLSRLYATQSQTMLAIAECDNERDLYRRVARIFVDIGGLGAATLVELNPDQPEEVNLVEAFFPIGSPRENEVNHLVADKWRLPTLTREVMTTGETRVSNDYPNDEAISPLWRDTARRLGLASCMTIPFSSDSRLRAIFTLSSEITGFFNQEVVALLTEVARSVSRAIKSIEHETLRKQAEAALARNEERLRLSLNVTNIGFFEADLATHRIRLDEVCARLTGVGDTDVELDLGEFFHAAGVPRPRVIGRERFSQSLQKGETFVRDYMRILPDGTRRWFRTQGGNTGERDAEGKLVRLLGVMSDITEARAIEERNLLAAAVFDNSGESIVIADASQKVLMANQAFARVTGYDPKEIIGTDIGLLKSERHDDAFYQGISDAISRDGVWQGEAWRRRSNGEEFPSLVLVSGVQNGRGKFTHYVVQETDISTQKEFEERISHLAYRDALTQLPNRTLLRDRIEQHLAVAHREGGSVALLFLDLDHFKNINDSLGHTAGDRLLKEIAQRLTQNVREADTVGRLGGDEFMIVLPEASADDAAHVAQKLLDASARPITFDTHSLTVSPSIGIALYPKDGTSFDELLKMADTAMYRAKDEGRNAYRFYTPEMNHAVFKRMVLESNLRQAIEKQEFQLHYQPKFDLAHHRLVGVEALIRWHRPDLGQVSPAQFIPVAEDSGLIEAIGTWVLEEACRQVKAWRDAGLAPFRIAVNFSARQFAARNIAELIVRTLAATGLTGDCLEMEITESLLAQDMDYTYEVMKSIKQLGVHVAIDDFGTGYSSLSYLKRFPIDRLKIDQSFVRDLVTDADDRSIATAVVTLGHSLGIRVIAEGVETAEQLQILREIGCDEAQGYYLGRPMPASEMTALLLKPSPAQ